MTTLAFNYSYWEFWTPYDPPEYFGPQRCTFDGENRLIIINITETDISVKEDIYSAWKEWSSVRDNSKFLPALRVTGGDPIGVGEFTGDVYFLINDWRIYIDHSCFIDGVIYSDDFPNPFVQAEGTQIVTNRVSSLVQTISPTINVEGITVPSAVDIRQEMDANSTRLSDIDSNVLAIDATLQGIDADLQAVLSTATPEQFWNYLLSTPMAPGSAGEKLKQVLTTGNFLALK